MNDRKMDEILAEESTRISHYIENEWHVRYPAFAATVLTSQVKGIAEDLHRVPDLSGNPFWKFLEASKLRRTVVPSRPICISDLRSSDRRGAMLEFVLDGLTQDAIGRLRYGCREAASHNVVSSQVMEPPRGWVNAWGGLWVYPGWMTLEYTGDSAFGSWCWSNVADKETNPDRTFGNFVGILECSFVLDHTKMLRF